MATWKAYVLFAVLQLLIGTRSGQRRYELEATTGTSPDQLYGNEEMSEDHEIKVGNKIEPIIFKSQCKIKLSRSTYKVTSYVDFKPYKQAFKQFGQYIRKFLADLHDPHYVNTLYKVGTYKGHTSVRRKEDETNTYFTDGICRQLTYHCRIQNQFIQLRNEADKVHQIYLETYRKFLRAIDHMEFHPTLDRTKTQTTTRDRRQSHGKEQTKRTSQYTSLREGLTEEDVLMLKQADELIKTKFLNQTTKPKRVKRFGLAGWIMGWGLGYFTSLRTIKDNIRTLQKQNLLQQNQIIELAHYLNITYAHVSTNRYAINNLQVQLVQINQSLMTTMKAVQFLRYTVAVITDVRIILSKLTLGICKGTGGYLCLMNQALYPIDRLEWCVFALFTDDKEKKREYCSINTHKRDANKAQSLEGYLWAITAFKPEKMQIRCLTDTHVIDIKPPLTIIYVGNGCEAYSNNFFIPAKSELTSTDSSMVRHNYFQQFNEQYQNITRYSLIEDLGIVQLTPKEIAKIPDRLTALPKLQFKELKTRLVEIKQPLNIHSNISFILIMIGGLILCPVIIYVLW